MPPSAEPLSTRARRLPLAVWIWLAALLIGAVIAGRASFTADLSAFLPRSPTEEQQLLVDQLRDGMISRLVLIGIEAPDPEARAALSRGLAQRLRQTEAFAAVNNGEPVSQKQDRAYLFNNRYLLSPAVDPQRFTVEGLRSALGETLDLLASPAGLMVKDMLAQDPTGEMAQLLSQFNGGRQPRKQGGVWVAKDGRRALLLAQTRAMGSDTDAQEQAVAAIRQAFEGARAELAKTRPEAASGKLLLTGPGVFSVNARNTITEEATRLSIISTAMIMVLLLAVYRSFVTLALGLLPVASGILAGVVAVSLGFGVVHGITLGFGTTLIGEAIDYSIYLFVQSGKSAGSAQWVKQFWPTIRLGVLTSISGFVALLFSGFPGLAQLGLYSVAGLVTASCVTRFVLPSLLPAGFAIRDLSHVGLRVQNLLGRLQRLKILVLALVVSACAILVYKHDRLWNTELNALSPVSAADQELDAMLRQDMGAPDVRYLVVVKGADVEQVLQSAERISARLEPLVEQGALASFETPSRYLPSMASQKMRLASLPPGDELARRLQQASAGMPFQPALMAPFVASVDRIASQAARQPERLLLTRDSLKGTSMALATDALLIDKGGQASGLLPLTASPNQEIDPARIRRVIEEAGVPKAYFVDMKLETDRLYRGYLHEAIVLSLCGLGAIAALLALALRSPRRLWAVLAPLGGAVLVVAGLLALCSQRMTILHLIGLLLIVAVGSNYALFFDQPNRGEQGAKSVAPSTLASLLFANVTTVIGFGLLGLSSVPVLNAIGVTVGPGAVLALLFSAIFSNSGSASRAEPSTSTTS